MIGGSQAKIKGGGPRAFLSNGFLMKIIFPFRRVILFLNRGSRRTLDGRTGGERWWQEVLGESLGGVWVAGGVG